LKERRVHRRFKKTMNEIIAEEQMTEQNDRQNKDLFV
jgi:hypothetical protein